MNRDHDPGPNATAKRAAALLREARAVQRRLDKLATAAAGEDATTLTQLAKPGTPWSDSSIIWRVRSGLSNAGLRKRADGNR